MTPFKGINRVTSTFGWRTYTYNGKEVQEFHRGQDVVPTKTPGEAVEESAWDVREVTGGVVLRIASDSARGLYVDVQTAEGVFERYQHLKTVLVEQGKTVAQGQVIAVAGSTGQCTGRHLHFGVYAGGSREANAVIPAAWSDLPNECGTYSGNDNYDDAAARTPTQTYEATALVKGLRVRTYPDVEQGTVVSSLEKGRSYPVLQTKNKWAFVTTAANAGGWACIEDAQGVYLSVGET
jgi:murein DD-endopeptidase MepM/ murein hydrolase activator NlpD